MSEIIVLWKHMNFNKYKHLYVNKDEKEDENEDESLLLTASPAAWPMAMAGRCNVIKFLSCVIWQSEQTLAHGRGIDEEDGSGRHTVEFINNDLSGIIEDSLLKFMKMFVKTR